MCIPLNPLKSSGAETGLHFPDEQINALDIATLRTPGDYPCKKYDYITMGGGDMYYLMNKDNVVLSFQAESKSGMTNAVSFVSEKQEGSVPYGYENITAWIESRKASKHNAHLKRIMERLKCADNEGFIRLTHAVGINDTFWIRNDEEDIVWSDVSLYRNQFSEVISRLAFEGTGLYFEGFSSSSPELSCEGSFRKCFRKENIRGEFGSDIFLYKRGGELGAGFEPYGEVLASEIAKIISPSAVQYDLSRLHGKIASKCNIFTNENIGYASYAKLRRQRTYTFRDVEDFFEKCGCEQSFREMLVVDSLCFNQDRHSGNYGVLYDNDTMNIVGMSPVFDLNLSMLPYVELAEFEYIGDKLYDYAPKLGDDFTEIGQMAMNDSIRDRLKDITDFTFSFRGDDAFSEERVKCLEHIVHKQAAAILSNEKLQTRKVFFSQKAEDDEKKFQKMEKAIEAMDQFMTRIDEGSFASSGFISVCKDENAVQLYLENNSYLLTVDFLKGTFGVTQNAQEISMKALKTDAPDFYADTKAIEKELCLFSQREDFRIFSKYFEAIECDRIV